MEMRKHTKRGESLSQQIENLIESKLGPLSKGSLIFLIKGQALMDCPDDQYTFLPWERKELEVNQCMLSFHHPSAQRQELLPLLQMQY